MFIFIDESGDAGFKLDTGSSPIFVILVIFRDAAQCDATRRWIERLRTQLGFNTEFRFSKSGDRLRDQFFENLAGCELEVRGLVVGKELVRSVALLKGRETFYDFFIRAAIARCASDIVDVEVIIDGRGEKLLTRALQANLRNGLSPSSVRKVSLRVSRKDALVQIADMAAGAIARAHRTQGGEERWMTTLARQGQLGRVHFYPEGNAAPASIRPLADTHTLRRLFNAGDDL